MKRTKKKKAIKPIALPEVTLWGRPCWLSWYSIKGNNATLGGFMGAYTTKRGAERAKELKKSARMDRS